MPIFRTIGCMLVHMLFSICTDIQPVILKMGI